MPTDIKIIKKKKDLLNCKEKDQYPSLMKNNAAMLQIRTRSIPLLMSPLWLSSL